MIENTIRKIICKRFTRETGFALDNRIPSSEGLSEKFKDIDELGVYLHIPFCKQICPYCPYNKEIYDPDVAKKYVAAVRKEIDVYAGIVGNRPVTSLYIGGGTPTTMLHNGIEDILTHLKSRLNIQCDIHMESHPNDLSAENLDKIGSMGIRHLSIGVEALQDRHLKTLKRPYTTEEVKVSVSRAVSNNFTCVNVDFIFGLPDQTHAEIEQAGHALVQLGVDQVAAYPLFRFPYTGFGSNSDGSIHKISTIFRRRKMLKILEDIFYSAGFDRTSVWAFTRRGVPRYCSVTVPLYIGLGASGGSYLKDIFYLNTFNVVEYIKTVNRDTLPIALSIDLTRHLQMAGWLYWRIYETRFRKEDFRNRFGTEFDSVYGKYIKPLSLLGFLKGDGEQIVLSDRGTYWLHALEDIFSINYISKLWGTSQTDPWPEKVVL